MKTGGGACRGAPYQTRKGALQGAAR